MIFQTNARSTTVKWRYEDVDVQYRNITSASHIQKSQQSFLVILFSFYNFFYVEKFYDMTNVLRHIFYDVISNIIIKR